MLARVSWASVRTALVLLGAPFVALSLASACLDYAGEDLFACDTAGATPDAGTATGSGSGSAAGSGSGSGAVAPAATEADCGAPPPATGSGSGSAS